MPRLPPHLLHKAYKLSPLLPLVLQVTRALPSAINELRWLKEHASISPQNPTQKPSQNPSRSVKEQRKALLKLCVRRSRAEPLQYILGSQPFGELDIKCQRGVLIPRTETETYTSYVAKLLLQDKPEGRTKAERKRDKLKKEKEKDLPLKILDVCSGSGCISLLLHSLLSAKIKDLTILGLDISAPALHLSRQNLLHNVEQGNMCAEASTQVRFESCDFLNGNPENFGPFDVIISNPPYISSKKFVTETSRSVRNYEPRLALVPPSPQNFERDPKDVQSEPEDVFYDRLLKMHEFSESRMLVMEVDDEEQARRVVRLAVVGDFLLFNRVEIWRDWPDGKPQRGEARIMRLEEPDQSSAPVSQSDTSPKKRVWELRPGWVVTMPNNTVRPASELEIPIIGTGRIRTVVLFRTSIPPKPWDHRNQNRNGFLSWSMTKNLHPMKEDSTQSTSLSSSSEDSQAPSSMKKKQMERFLALNEEYISKIALMDKELQKPDFTSVQTEASRIARKNLARRMKDETRRSSLE